MTAALRHLSMVLALLVNNSVNAEIVKTAVPSDGKIQFYWWPKVVPPPGWHQEEEASVNYGVAALVPNGTTFKDSVAIIYAKADYKPRVQKWKSLSELINDDKRDSASAFPETEIRSEDAVSDGSGRMLQVLQFQPGPGAKGNWEKVAYGEEKEFYLVFTLSARTQAAINQYADAFSKVVRSYTTAKEDRP